MWAMKAPTRGTKTLALGFNPLCSIAHSFPSLAAKILERDAGLTRNFREETITDLLMASLVGLRPLGIRVDFPDEPFTGGDMDWIFAAPLEFKGGRYLTVRLQAKRAQRVKRKKGDYWCYRHLDHGNGMQAQSLVKPAPGVLPLYIMYNPLPALAPKVRSLPAVEGVNLVLAHHIAAVVTKKCAIKDKKVDRWRPHFMPLSDILCWPVLKPDPSAASSEGAVDEPALPPDVTLGFHPDLVIKRFRARSHTAIDVEPVNDIPPALRRAIEGNDTALDRRQIKKPRIILTSQLRRNTPEFSDAEQRS
jgi:hypothetical protein